MILALVFLVAGYSALIFPFAYFRHDDWYILGNAALHLPGNWKFAFSSTLFVGNTEVVWFFRPLFKIFVYFFYEWFGFHYWIWLLGLTFFCCGAFIFSSLAIEKLTGAREKGVLFTVLFAAAIPLHVGSLAWMGEGMMNCPQLFFLALSTYAFVLGFHRTLGSRIGFCLLSLASYFLSLGFKESSIFHIAFLSALLFHEPFFGTNRRQKLLWLSPFAVLTAVYLVYRTLFLPMNGSYSPLLKTLAILRPIAFIVGTFSLVVAAWALSEGPRWSTVLQDWREALRKKWMLALVVAGSCLPYLAHDFFSPGWLLLPGSYFLWMLVLTIPRGSLELSPAFIRRTGSWLLVLSLVPVTAWMVHAHWWEWRKPQKAMEAIVESIPDRSITGIIIFDCVGERRPELQFARIVGFDAALGYLWRLHHCSSIPVSVVPCTNHFDSFFDWHVRHARGEKVFLKWEYPELTRMVPSAVVLRSR
jgi:hypothetical protein